MFMTGANSMKKIVKLDYYREKRCNDSLLDFIQSSLSDRDFLATHTHLVKYCILEWMEAEAKLKLLSAEDS